MKIKRIDEKQAPTNSTPAGSKARRWVYATEIHSMDERGTTQDVVVLKNDNMPCWQRYIVMPLNARESVWLNDEMEAKHAAQQLAVATQGRVLYRF